MFNSNLSINDASAVAKSFNLVFQNGTETRRQDTATDHITPRVMVVRHSESTRNGITTQRHNVLFSKRVETAEGEFVDAVCSVALTVPQDGAVTQAIVDDLIAFAKNFLTTGNTTQLLRGES